MASGEFLSCVMATKDRPGFLRIALDCFLRQTYRDSELIVVDDGEQPVEELCSGKDRVRYLRVPPPAGVAAKLNLGVEAARGKVIQKLDDDDYYQPDFLAIAMDHLPRRGRTRSLVAWDCFLILHTSDGTVRQSGHGWRAGGTFCFSRAMWERKGFRHVPGSVDSCFVYDNQPRLIPVCAADQYLLVRHGRNTWTRMRDSEDADEFLRTLPVHDQSLEAVVGAEAAAFYRSMGSQA